MRRHHELPFGAELTRDGVRFRLWAPAAESVALHLDDLGELPMVRRDGGWFELTTAAARAGSRYRYVVGGQAVPDPASRHQPEDVHGPSEVIDPDSYDWRDGDWRGRRWEEIVVYELHTGAFSERGDFAGVERHLDHLVRLGVTAVELMPVADFPGKRNWGYDGVLLFAPDSRYGRPEDLKRLVDACHVRGLAAFLDVVYNHFGPEGNYLHLYASQFFTERHHTPWGAAINFDGAEARPVRDFYVENALYWLEEFHFDGLRFDAVHAIRDDSQRDILVEIAEAVRARFSSERPIHLVLENDGNEARLLSPGLFTAQWNDDLHHALRVLTTGESAGYYADYADAPAERLGRALAEGFAYQGEMSGYRDETRGEPSAHLPPTRFVSFIQNHDQVGNNAFGTRLARLAKPEAIRVAATAYLLAPQIPMIFMGEEWGADQPFTFFCDFAADLAEKVREGRRREFAKFPEFRDEAARARIPDPCDAATFASAVLDWRAAEGPPYSEWLGWYRGLLALRAREIAPRLRGMRGNAGAWRALGPRALRVDWRLGDGSGLTLFANFGPDAVALAESPQGRLLHATGEAPRAALAALSAAFFLGESIGG
ncbi:MAG TPA: malto-oligosyltrehalose trehalohydrolase [Stellaceae bacterium]|nr:malto-oligosyltrehalose trehalohydrolase [Stellaceae bacterium]